MNYILSFLIFLSSSVALCQSSPCYWGAGNVAQCFPSNGIYLDNSRAIRLGTNNSTNYVQVQATNGMGSNYTFKLPAAQGAANTTFQNDGSGNLTFAKVPLASGVTGTLPIANGGTNATSYTTGSIPYFNGTSLTQDNANLFWDGTNHFLGIGTATPKAGIDATNYVRILGSVGAASGVPASGTGLELTYDTNADVGNIYTYNRPVLGFKSLQIDGLPLVFNKNAASYTEASNYVRFIGSAGAATGNPTTGSGLEVTYNATTDVGSLFSYNRSTSIFKKMEINGSTLSINTSSGGNVGIGTTSPQGVLHIRHSQSGGLLGDARQIILDNSSGSAGERVEIGYGYKGGTYQPVVAGSLITDNSAQTKANFYVATRDVTSDTAPTVRTVVTSAGNMGIGTTAPPSLLTVSSGDKFQVDSNGNIVKVNNVTSSFPASQGGASTFLQNDGSGNLSWTAALVNPMTTLGDILYEDATPAPARLAGNITTTQKALVQTGTGSVSAAPSWGIALSSGTYTPTFTNQANCTANTIGIAQWMRVGNVVTVSGTIDISTTTALGTASEFELTLPITSVFTDIRQAGGSGGSGSAGTGGTEAFRIFSVAADGNVDVNFDAFATANRTMSYIFTYQIL